MEQPIIRRATRRDRSEILGLHEALYVHHRAAVLPEARVALVDYRDFQAVLREDVDAMLASESYAVLVAEHGGRIVGYITGNVERDPRRVLTRRGVVGDWYVDEAMRGRQVGKRLLERLEAIFVAARCDVVESQTWATNEGARRAHDALGFLEVQVVYRKRLPSP